MKDEFIKMVSGMLSNIDCDIQSLQAKIEHLKEVRDKVSGLLEYVEKGDKENASNIG